MWKIQVTRSLEITQKVVSIVSNRHTGKAVLWAHSLNSWTMDVWTLRLWTLGLWTIWRLGSGRLDSGRLDAWTLYNWTLGLCMLRCLHSGPLGSGRLEAWTLDTWTLGIWTLGLHVRIFKDYFYSIESINFNADIFRILYWSRFFTFQKKFVLFTLLKVL